MNGSHVANHEWATWHLTTCQINSTCSSPIRPRLPHVFHVSVLTVLTTLSCATCHPCSGAMCHDLTRPHLHLPTLALMDPATSSVHSYELYNHLPRQHCTDYTVNIFFYHKLCEAGLSSYWCSSKIKTSMTLIANIRKTK
jgi:hypothetical protein